MKSTTVLMFGWEFPPHITGGLGTACYGLTKALIEQRTKVLFVVPKAHGDEDIVLINSSDILLKNTESLKGAVSETFKATSDELLEIQVTSQLMPYTQSEQWSGRDVISHWNYQFDSRKTKEIETKSGKKYAFSGSYGPTLFDEVEKFSEVASTIASQYSFDVIHAHDWLAYMAGIAAKTVSGKPLVVHVHATEFDRTGEKDINQRVFEIEQRGMMEADRVISVSQWTKNIVVSKYKIPAEKVEVVHNGVIPDDINAISFLPKIADKVVTYLGRVTWQKGPQYFVHAAWKVLKHFPETHFIMAGSGDLMPRMIELAAQLKMSDHFHFTGFLRGVQINQVWNVSDVYVMPSVSEPFGITPLEAMQADVPVIVSNQSGVAEVLDHAIKVDFWDTDTLADAIISVIKHKSLSTALRDNGKKELRSISWNKAATKINAIYHELQRQTQSVH